MASIVTGSRFKAIKVTKRVSIKAFVEEKKLRFEKGRGFYQLTKPEVIQDYKEVIVRRQADKQIVTGDKVREVLKIPKSAKKFKLDLEEVGDFDVFVQSTSVNRVLLPDTEFLYEAEEETATVRTWTCSAIIDYVPYNLWCNTVDFSCYGNFCTRTQQRYTEVCR